MTRLLLYTHKINNMGDHRIPMLALNSSQNQIPVPVECNLGSPQNLGEIDGQMVLVDQDQKELHSDCVRMWKLNEAVQRYEIWCELRTTANVLIIPLVITSNGLIMVRDCQMNLSIFNSNGKLLVENITLQSNHMAQEPTPFISSFSFESNNLWWQ